MTFQGERRVQRRAPSEWAGAAQGSPFAPTVAARCRQLLGTTVAPPNVGETRPPDYRDRYECLTGVSLRRLNRERGEIPAARQHHRIAASNHRFVEVTPRARADSKIAKDFEGVPTRALR